MICLPIIIQLWMVCLSLSSRSILLIRTTTCTDCKSPRKSAEKELHIVSSYLYLFVSIFVSNTYIIWGSISAVRSPSPDGRKVCCIEIQFPLLFPKFRIMRGFPRHPPKNPSDPLSSTSYQYRRMCHRHGFPVLRHENKDFSPILYHNTCGRAIDHFRTSTFQGKGVWRSVIAVDATSSRHSRRCGIEEHHSSGSRQ